ncbi:MAG: RNA methyltransferase [Spirochaetaceae bacterium]|nr:RNA methyltransferase [Spirochaetaceae bacterium]
MDSELAEKGHLALEGAFLIERGIVAGLEILQLFCVPARAAWASALLAQAQGSRPAPVRDSLPAPIVLPESEIARIAGYPFHRGALGIARRPTPPTELPTPAEGDSTILALPESGDPENIGSAFRSAAAMGCAALLLGPKGPDPYSRRILRVSMGASLTLPWARLQGPEGLSSLATRGYRCAACVLDSEAIEVDAYSRPPRLVLVMGNEAYGLSPPWLEACDDRITLSMSGGVDSLNAAVAAAVFLYATRCS